MCGITGVLNRNGEPVEANLLHRMTDIIGHRGPDGEGHYAEGPIGLGHRRLAIIDLSAAGHQPMMSSSGQYVLVYNGEVYNFQDLRAELETKGYWFRSRTDSEVVLNAFAEWQEACLSRFNGMFAFAMWDRRRRRLTLARDRYGIKPLYWTLKNGTCVFASEIKAMLRHPDVGCDVSYPALNEYFTFQNVLSDLTLFEGIRLLPPGCVLTLDLDGSFEPQICRYWDYTAPVESLRQSAEECAEELYHLLVRSVTRELMSDVPLGAYLSGGLDSGSITSIARHHLPRLTTFTGGFDLTSASGLELSFDERPRAETMANLFKTEHYEVVMHAGDMEWAMQSLVWHLEDLRLGQSYPNYYIARLASKFVKVVLSGAGGDELFGGYPWRYYRGANSASREDYFARYYQFWQRLVPDEDKKRLFNESALHKIGDHSTFDVFRDVFVGWQGTFTGPEDYVAASLYFELKTFLHGLLVVEDKLSMAHSLETRLPVLDNDPVAFPCRLPVRHKLTDPRGVARRVDENDIGKYLQSLMRTVDGKAVLRQAMRRLIPSDITESIKQGFSAPDASWFRGESIDYINRLLRDPKAAIYEFLEPSYVNEVLDEHCSGHVNRRLLIWSLLSFESWCRCFLRAGGGTVAARSGDARETAVRGTSY